jgi:hypothetical protein
MREKTVVALFDRFADAKAAVGDLIQAGAPRDQIALLANTSMGDHPALSLNPAFAGEEFDTDSHEQPGMVTGAEVGIGVGGILGFLLGISTLSIPGLGFLIAAGTWATVAAGAATGGVIGAVVGRLTDHGVSDRDAKLYAEGLKRGGTLVTAVVAEEKVAAMSAVFKTHGAVDIEDRLAPWTAEGWVSFDRGEDFLPHVDIAAMAAAGGQPHAA